MSFIIEVRASDDRKMYYVQGGWDQPDCIPSLTEDINKAKKYKTIDKAKSAATNYKQTMFDAYDNNMVVCYFTEVFVHEVRLTKYNTEKI